MDTPLLVVAIVVILGVALFVVSSESQKRQTLWATLAGQLGLTQQGSVLVGELEGVPVRIAVETRRNPDGYGQFCVVRAAIPGALPAGFVAAPRRWTSGLDRMLADNTFPTSDPALKECYVFQSDAPQEGQALIEQPEVQKALLELYSPKRVGFVEKGGAHVAYAGLVEDVEEMRRALRDVVQTARTLAQAHAGRVPGPESQPAS